MLLSLVDEFSVTVPVPVPVSPFLEVYSCLRSAAMASSDPEKHLSHSPAASNDDISPAPSAHLDDEYQTYKDGRDLETDPAELKRVLRKIDFRIIPILFVTYMLQYLDKNSINFASVYGLQKGTHINGSQYSWLGKSSPVPIPK